MNYGMYGCLRLFHTSYKGMDHIFVKVRCCHGAHQCLASLLRGESVWILPTMKEREREMKQKLGSCQHQRCLATR